MVIIPHIQPQSQQLAVEITKSVQKEPLLPIEAIMFLSFLQLTLNLLAFDCHHPKLDILMRSILSHRYHILFWSHYWIIRCVLTNRVCGFGLYYIQGDAGKEESENIPKAVNDKDCIRNHRLKEELCIRGKKPISNKVDKAVAHHRKAIATIEDSGDVLMELSTNHS